jgi:hypothetical protein
VPVTVEDLIGGLEAALAKAAASADVTSVGMAEIYQGDPLLRHIPAPQTRLLTLEVTLRMALGEAPREAVLSDLQNDLRDLAARLAGSAPVTGWLRPGLDLGELFAAAEGVLRSRLGGLFGTLEAAPGPVLLDQAAQTIAVHVMSLVKRERRGRFFWGLLHVPACSPGVLQARLKGEAAAGVDDIVSRRLAQDALVGTAPGAMPRLLVTAQDLNPIAPPAIGSMTLHLQMQRSTTGEAVVAVVAADAAVAQDAATARRAATARDAAQAGDAGT